MTILTHKRFLTRRTVLTGAVVTTGAAMVGNGLAAEPADQLDHLVVWLKSYDANFYSWKPFEIADMIEDARVGKFVDPLA